MTSALSRFLRYFLPNAVTGFGLVCGLLSLVAAHEGRLRDAAWLIAWAVLTDKLDGTIARRLRGTSEFGVQMDSFADCVAFGVAPPFLLVATLGDAPALPFATGAGHALLLASAAAWALAAVFRLARFNVAIHDERAKGIFFGFPTTAAAGLFSLWFLVLLKYADPALGLGAPGAFGELLLLGDLRIGGWAWGLFPPAMLAGALLMASSLRIPKLGRFPSRVGTALVFAAVGVGYVLGWLRAYAELIVWIPTTGMMVFTFVGFTSKTMRGVRPPPIFPRVEG
jgi:CDP-diacylglycerol--serine O-phosphatidyltransferase